MDSDDKKITQLPIVTSLSDSDLLVTVVNIGTAPQTKAIAKSNAVTGGLTVTAATVTTSNVTGVEGTLHNLDVSGMTANRDFNLPTPSAAGKRIGVRLSTGDDTYALLLKINAVEWSRIFITSEIVIFVSTGTGAGDWAIEQDGRIPCVARLKETASQNINNNTTTLLTMNTVVFDNASIASIANDRITVRRANKYTLSGGYFISNLTANAVRVNGSIYINGVSQAVSSEFPGTAGGYPAPSIVAVESLAVASYIDIRAYHNSGATEATLGGFTHVECVEVLT